MMMMMMMIRRRTSLARRTRATRGVTSPTRRSLMVKLILVKSGSPIMRAPTPILVV
jgi:hypothetical protein